MWALIVLGAVCFVQTERATTEPTDNSSLDKTLDTTLDKSLVQNKDKIMDNSDIALNKTQVKPLDKTIDQFLTLNKPSHKSVDKKHESRPAEIVRLDLDASSTDFLPITFQDIDIGPDEDDSSRPRRSPQRNNVDAFDDNYARFKKSFNNRKERGNYRVDDEDEKGSGEDEEDEEDEEENESEEQPPPKKGKKTKNAKSKNAETDEDFDRIREESNKAKKSKFCRVERRGNMYCNVCFNPKTKDSAESCSFKSDPREKKYAFSQEKKYRNKDGELQKDSGERELVTHRPPTYYRRAPYTRPIPAPQFRRPSFTMAYVPRYGYVLAPSRRPPPQRPIPQRYSPYVKNVPKRYVQAGQESRPQREVIGVGTTHQPYEEKSKDPFSEKENDHVERLKKNHTKARDDNDYHGSRGGVDKVLAEFKAKDWSKCKHSTKGDLTCYSCVDSKGGRTEECVYDSEAENKKPHYSELKSYSETAFGDDVDVEDFFKDKPTRKITKKSPPKKAFTRSPPTLETSTAGNYNFKMTFGEVEDHLTPEADLFPWEPSTGPSLSKQQSKRMVSSAYRKENRDADESRVTTYGHEVIHTV